MPGSLIDQTDLSDTDIRQGMPSNMLTSTGVFGYTPLKFSPCLIEYLNLRSEY
jgi:hypothetical protein